MNTRKTRSDATWPSLPQEARDQIETWLFDDHLGYTDAFQKAKTELAFSGSLSSFKRFGLHLANQRVLTQFADTSKQTRTIEKAKTSEDQLRNAGMKVMAQAFLHQVVQFPENVRQWGWIAKLLIQNQENQLRDKTIELARERFHFEAIEKSVDALPELKQLEQMRKSPKRRKIDYAATILAVRRRVFGEHLPDRYHTTSDPAEQAAIEAESNRILSALHKKEAEEKAAENEPHEPQEPADPVGSELTEKASQPPLKAGPENAPSPHQLA